MVYMIRWPREVPHPIDVQGLNIEGSAPFFLAYEEKKVSCYDAKELMEKMDRAPAKIHLFALEQFAFIYVTLASTSLVKELYFSEDPQFPLESREELIDAFRFYHHFQRYPLYRRCYQKARQAAEEEGSVALFLGLALKDHPEKQEANKALLYFLKGADKKNAEAVTHALAFLKGSPLHSPEYIRMRSSRMPQAQQAPLRATHRGAALRFHSCLILLGARAHPKNGRV